MVRTSENDETSTILQRALPGAVPAQTATFRLRVHAGPNTGSELVVDDALEILVGKSPVCALALTDPSVSRRHCSLDIDGTRLKVRDLESTNGTYVNGVEVVEAFLHGGEELSIGDTRIHVSLVGVAPSVGRVTESSNTTTFGSFIAKSRAMTRLFPTLQRLAKSHVPVLIEGETGTGKEVISRALHEASPRAKGPFIVFDCAAVAANVIESELFGHERGAYTGAVGTRKGVFEQADGGTLLIDELGELPLDLQSKLLRAIERSEVRRVGGNQWIQCDVRVIAATRRNMDTLVESGLFRDDLFYRLAVGRIELPALRQRREDIPLLVEFFAKQVGEADAPKVPGHILAEWQRRPWPGNLRELRNVVFRYYSLGDLEDLPSEGHGVAGRPDESVSTIEVASGESEIDAILHQRLPFPQARDRVQKTFEQRYVKHLLDEHGGSVQKAAKAAGISARYFQILMARGTE